MHWLLADETNAGTTDGQFFVYGGLIFPPEAIPRIHSEIAQLRTAFGLKTGQDLKFSNQKGVSPEVQGEIKKAVLELVAENGCKFVATAVLHEIRANKSEERGMEFAINTVTLLFRRYLEAEESYGGMLIDRVDKKYVNGTLNSMASNFQDGLSFFNDFQLKVNDKILVFGMTNNSSSHLTSCSDIVLGSFGYCVNASTGHAKANWETAAKIMPKIKQLFWGGSSSDVVFEPSGFALSPQKVSAFGNQYFDLRKKLRVLSGGQLDE